MNDRTFSIRRYFSKPRRKALIAGLTVLVSIIFLETVIPLSNNVFVLVTIAFSAAISTYFLMERGERLQLNIEDQNLALNQAVRNLEKSRASLQEIIAFSPVPTIIANDTTNRPEYFNNKFIETFGYTLDDIPTIESWWEKAYPDENCREEARTRWEEGVQEALEKNTHLETRERDIVCKDGTRKSATFDMMPIGKKSVIVMTDITERKKIEKELRESEERFRSLFQDSADAYLILDENVFVDCNQATIEMLGASSKEEVLSTHPSQLSPEFQLDGRLSSEKADEIIRIALEQGSNRFEWIHRRMDGEDFPVEVLLTPISVGEKTIIHTVWRDIRHPQSSGKHI